MSYGMYGVDAMITYLEERVSKCTPSKERKRLRKKLNEYRQYKKEAKLMKLLGVQRD